MHTATVAIVHKTDISINFVVVIIVVAMGVVVMAVVVAYTS